MGLVQKWDFEDGTTQGWSYEPTYTSFVSNNDLNGTYGFKWSRSGLFNRYVAEVIQGPSVDFSLINRPVVVFGFRIRLYTTPTTAYGIIYRVIVRLRDTTTGNVIEEKYIYIYKAASGIDWAKRYVIGAVFSSTTSTTVSIEIAIDVYSGSSTITIEADIDNIGLYDGGDYLYNVPVWVDADGVVTSTISIPDSDVSALTTPTLSINHVGLETNFAVKSCSVHYVYDTSEHDLGYSDGEATNLLANSVNVSGVPADIKYVNSITVQYKGGSSTSVETEDGWEVVVAATGGWDAQRVWVFRWMLTLNPFLPVQVAIAMPGALNTERTADKTLNVKINCSSMDITPRVVYTRGDNTVVAAGSKVLIEVYDETDSVLQGSSNIDLTTGTDITGPAITGLSGNTLYKLHIKPDITASAAISLLVYIKIDATG